MNPSSEEKKELYELSFRQVEEFLRDESDSVVVMASVVCILKENLPHAFWVGFYRVDSGKGDELVIGPYQGTMGCLRIPFGKGVCGHCAAIKQTVIVPDVHEFPGHIACDSKSKSEIVVPVFNKQNELLAVLDLDAIEVGAFSDIDRAGLEAITTLLSKKL